MDPVKSDQLVGRAQIDVIGGAQPDIIAAVGNIIDCSAEPGEVVDGCLIRCAGRKVTGIAR